MNQIAKNRGILCITLIVAVMLPVCRGQDNTKRIAAMDECGSEMTESECDSKIQRDLASAIHKGKEGCSFEPDWRPTHLAERTLSVSEVNGTTTVIAIDGKNYTLQIGDYRNSACQEQRGRDCSRWKPELGKEYPVTIIDRPRYLNTCLNRELPAKRTLCIGFGQIKQETLPYGVSRTPQLEVCYGVPVS